MYVDPLIYANIKNSHPYITGLSIVMGLASFGTTGAVLGPLLVCLTNTVFTVWGRFMPHEGVTLPKRSKDVTVRFAGSPERLLSRIKLS
jgi:predicted PurR-regulated permease PerM